MLEESEVQKFLELGQLQSCRWKVYVQLEVDVKSSGPTAGRFAAHARYPGPRAARCKPNPSALPNRCPYLGSSRPGSLENSDTETLEPRLWIQRRRSAPGYKRVMNSPHAILHDTDINWHSLGR